MLVTSHALVGAAIAKLIPNPYLGYPINLCSHFLLDLIPHWDFRTRKIIHSKTRTIAVSLSDAFIGFFLGWLIFKSQVTYAYLFPMMFIAQLPDWLEAPFHILNWSFPPFSTIKKLQSRLHHKLNLPWGLVLQILVVVLVVLIAKL
ncbi:MAG: hypothetical protein NTZ93_01180 [Candidatus Beckwithbacteria bacterium]|nr:hypothetical protein [Candidatus Beckwithbacteria bacterium]